MPRKVSDETKQKISNSLKVYHEIRKAPSPRQQRAEMLQEAFKEETGLVVPVRNYGKVDVEDQKVQKRTETQNKAPQEKE